MSKREKIVNFSALEDCANKKERSLEMQFIPIVVQSILIVTLSTGIVFGLIDSEKNDPGNQTIETIKGCMSRSPSQWPDEWKKEYLETIRSAIELNRDAAHYTTRLDILRNAFESYWISIKKNEERSLFKAQQAQIRWYIENLMHTEFPTDKERQKLRDQYKNLLDHAANSLLKQFPFLDPNDVQASKADELNTCYRRINVPLMPVYLRPMSAEHIQRIKQRWDKLRYRRVDLWRRFRDSSKTPAEKRDAPSSDSELDCELIKKSLSQLLGQVWIVASERPDYYISALKNRSRAIKYFHLGHRLEDVVKREMELARR